MLFITLHFTTPSTCTRTERTQTVGSVGGSCFLCPPDFVKLAQHLWEILMRAQEGSLVRLLTNPAWNVLHSPPI